MRNDAVRLHVARIDCTREYALLLCSVLYGYADMLLCICSIRVVDEWVHTHRKLYTASRVLGERASKTLDERALWELGTEK